MPREHRICPFLWFDDNAEEAAELYVSVFPNSRVVSVARNGAGEAGMVTFDLDGRRFMALNGGPHFTFNEAISLFVDCPEQSEIDRLWEALTADGGAPGRCGWLKDRFGLSWQIVPSALGELMQDDDPEQARRVHAAMMTMQKLDLAGLEAAHRGD
jgi:predicted 3-demethylubiquinone-9 3-methyltransferase (glyoxalase superfamily)